jgi:L-threonylcarbamoyladenylate synthase
MTLRTRDIAAAARLLAAGELVAFPTETVYGLGADALSDRAVAQVFEAKGRPAFNPLIVHVASLEAALKFGIFDETAMRLAGKFWPGPLTLVVPGVSGSPVSHLATAGLKSIALRLPAHPVAHALLLLVDRPIVAPSANPSGRLSPTLPEHVLTAFEGRISALLDAGPALIGVESTIVSCTHGEVKLLRPGGIACEALEHVLARPVEWAKTDPSRPTSPGQLAQHYAPRAKLRLDVTAPEPGEAFVQFGPDAPAHTGLTVNLSPTGDLVEAAGNLFRFLHELDARGLERIAVMPVPMNGLGLAINDRLRRAAG